MATFPVIHKDTGEQKEVVMSVDEWEQWKENNQDWIRDWSDPSTCPGSGEVGEWKDKLISRNPGWKTVLDKVKNNPKSIAKNLY